MGLCVVMNRCAAVEGGAEGGEGGKEEREGVGEEVVGEEELEVGCTCVCWRDCGFGVADHWNHFFHSETIYCLDTEEVCGVGSVNGYDRAGCARWKVWQPTGFKLWIVQETEEIECWRLLF